MNRKFLSTLALVGISFAALADGPPAAPAPLVTVERAVSVTQSAGKKYVGYLEAIEEVELRARISGNINKSHFKEGDLVKEGQLLFELEDTSYRAKVLACKAQIAQIGAELKFAEDNFNRQKTLHGSKAVSQSTLDEAERLLALNKAKLAEAEASLLDAENNLSYCKIFAPISGRIGKATYSQGNYVTPSSDFLADIVRIDPIYARFAISERDFQSIFGNADTLKKQAVIRLTLSDGSTYKHGGKIAFLDNKVDVGTNTLTIWATFENQESLLMPGGFVTVTLARQAERALPGIKLSAMMTGIDRADNQTKNFVYVLDDNNVVSQRFVTPGPLVGGQQLMLDGLKEGEVVIVAGTNKVQPGGTVEPYWPKQTEK